MWRSLLRVGALLVAAVGMPLSLILVTVAVTPEGRLFALAGLASSGMPLTFALGRQSVCSAARRRWLLLSASGALVWGMLTILLAAWAPDGQASATARVVHRYPAGGNYARFALGNLLPEVDQLRLAFHLGPCLDRLFTFRQARELSAMTARLYAELEAEPDFRALGTVLPVISGAAWEARGGHALVYRPPGLDRTKAAPVLVFLHGSGGSWKAYTWILARLADELGAVLVAPSGGMGWWPSPGVERQLQALLQESVLEVRIDAAAVHLLGLSNGGIGVSRAGRNLADRFASLTFLSPVIDERAAIGLEFADAWRGRPVHVLSGAADERIPVGYLRNIADQWRAAGIRVEFRAVAGVDHFLIFSERQLVVEQLAAWLRATRR